MRCPLEACSVITPPARVNSHAHPLEPVDVDEEAAVCGRPEMHRATYISFRR